MYWQAVAVALKKKKTVAGAASIPSVVTFTELLYPPHPDDDLMKASKLAKVRICLMVSYSCENPRCVRNTACQVKMLNSMTTAACRECCHLIDPALRYYKAA